MYQINSKYFLFGNIYMLIWNFLMIYYDKKINIYFELMKY